MSRQSEILRNTVIILLGIFVAIWLLYKYSRWADGTLYMVSWPGHETVLVEGRCLNSTHPCGLSFTDTYGHKYNCITGAVVKRFDDKARTVPGAIDYNYHKYQGRR
jgi:hypothetical protein